MNTVKQKQLRRNYCQMLRGEWASELPQDMDFWYMLRSEGVFFCACKKLSEAQRQQIPDEIMKGMDERAYTASSLRMKHALGHILRELNAAHVPVICLRGQALAESLYEPASMRAYSDFDLLFDQQNSLVLKQILGNRLMYRPADKFPSLFKKGDFIIDLHSEPLGIERMQSWSHLTPLRAPDFFKHAETGMLASEEALYIHPRVNLPYLCFHAMKHSFDRLIWLYDIALLAEKIEGDVKRNIEKNIEKRGGWDAVLEGICEYKLERPCFYALAYVQEHLNAPVPGYILEAIRPDMGFVERRLFARHMKFEVIPYLAERLFARMQPSFKHRVEFWRETIYPSDEIRAQIAGGGCVKCGFIRRRIKQITRACLFFVRECYFLFRHP
ncbi:MAG: nucleotidyltransferase family protein [Mariprofundaceae bacterium]|nr:nucleotidyltransferase family protein [Mariprofundaceae bacterium]